jgi:hypothetical protein
MKANRGGRPKIAPEVKTLPPVVVPLNVATLAKELAEYEGLSLAGFIREAVVSHTKTRQAQMKHA